MEKVNWGLTPPYRTLSAEQGVGHQGTCVGMGKICLWESWLRGRDNLAVNVTLSGAEEAKNRRVVSVYTYMCMYIYAYVYTRVHACVCVSGHVRQRKAGTERYGDTLCDGVVAGNHPKMMRVSVTLVQKKPMHIQRNLSRDLGARHLV